MATITNNVMAMQNELRNKEGITGMDSMHHVLMVLLAKSFTTEQCQKLNIPEEYAFENMIGLNKTELYNKFYNPRNSQNCVMRYIRQGDMFGYTKDLPFQIKNESTLEYMYHRINNISTDELLNTYDVIGDIYEHFINREGKTMKDLGQYFTDRGLIKFLVSLCNPQSTDGNVPTVWDPSSGTGGFLIEYIRQLTEANPGINWSLNKNNIFANDINKNTYSLLKQNLYYSFKEGSGITIKLLDSLVSNDDQMFDFILANPPFGIKGLKYKDMNDQIKSLGINGTKGEILFLQLCMCKLNENGKCAIVVPEGVLFNSTKMYKDTRKHLLENFNLKKVIKVGEGEFFKNTSVKTSVLFFEKTGQTENVEFIKVNKVNDSIEEVPLMTVEMDKIIENDYSLNMNLYKEIILDVIEGFEVFELGDLVEQIKDPLKKEDITSEYIECINIGAVNRNSNHYNLFKQSKIDYKNKSMNISKRGDILLSSVRPNLKKNIIVNSGILFNSGFINLRVNKDNINSKYLYYVINHDIINDILVDIASSTSSLYPTINFNVIKKLKIPVPPLEVQNRIVEQLDNIYETEIESSKKLIDSLKMSIETIMKNTMYRDDLQEYKIKDVCNHECFNYEKDNSKEYKYLDISCINTKEYKILKGNELPGRAKHHVQINDIIVSTVRPNLKKITKITDTSNNIIVTNGCCCLRCNDELIHPIILKSILLSDNVTKHFVENTTGSSYPVISYEEIYNLKIRIPSIEVQKQILEKIEPKESLIQELETNIERAEQEAKDIMSVLFN